MDKPVLLTGIRPTGDLHLGHYFSLIKPIIQYVDTHTIYVLIADLHALTELRKYSKIDLARLRREINENINNSVKTISSFVPVDKLIIFRQSDLKNYHYDLFYRLLMLSRNHLTYGNPVFQDAMRSEYEKSIDELKLSQRVRDLLKEFIRCNPESMYGSITPTMQHNLAIHLRLSTSEITGNGITESFGMQATENISDALIDKIVKHLNTRVGVMGLASYPILMAADIILYGPDAVLIGKDQLPHIQITNEFVKILNNTFGAQIKSTKPLVVGSQTIKGNDGVKMSKTLNNHLPIVDLINKTEAARQWFMKMRTFPRRLNEPGDPDQCPLCEFYSSFLEGNLIQPVCKTGLTRCVDCKSHVYESVQYMISESAQCEDCSRVESILKMGMIMAEARIMKNEKILDVLI